MIPFWLLLISAGGAAEVSPARTGWVTKSSNPQRRRCGTSLSSRESGLLRFFFRRPGLQPRRKVSYNNGL
jgi:hypothetical protein